MGQPQAKDAKPGQPPIVKRPQQVARGGGVRTQTVSDALVGKSDDGSQAQHGKGVTVTVPVPLDTIRCQPVVIRYKTQEVKSLIDKKVPVQLLLKPREGAPIPMNASDDNYFAIVDLPPGNHTFRFLIGDMPKVDGNQPIVNDVAPSGGLEAYNCIAVGDTILTTKDDDDVIDDGSGWGQTETQFDETRKYPPILPPHLRYTPLNTPPTQMRCLQDGSINVAQDTPRMLEAEHLPLPLSVTINHVYFQKREDHVVSGMTTRYCNKFTTIAYYKGIPSALPSCNATA